MLGSIVLAFVYLGQPEQTQPDAAALVEKLGAATFSEREATKSLEGLGRKALPALRSALKSRDAEVRRRARSMINKIEGNLLVEATPVRLDFQDVELDAVIRSLGKQAGFTIRLDTPGPAPFGMTMQHVTAHDPAPVPFWSALDRVFDAAGLAYRAQQGSPQHVMASLSGPPPDLILTSHPRLASPPRSVHGPFHVSVMLIHYQSQISFYSYLPANASVRGARDGPAQAAIKGARRPPGLARDDAIAPPPGKDARRAGTEPVRTSHFNVQLQVIPEPRMTSAQIGRVQLLEAIDEVGNSLVPGSVPGSTRAGIRSTGISRTGIIMTSSIELVKPESAGKQIKRLRGTLELFLVARQTDPLVIPLENAAGKTFHNDTLHVVVEAIETDQAAQDRIELAIEEIDELFPESSRDGVGSAARNTVPAMRDSLGFGGGTDPRSPIQLIGSRGQIIAFQLMFDRDSGRLKLTAFRPPNRGEIKELRLWNVVRAQTDVPFEFQDLPMP
jgi:hypothetical protein